MVNARLLFLASLLGAGAAMPARPDTGAPGAAMPGAGASPAPVDGGILSGLGARNIGSAAMSGRISKKSKRSLR